MSFEDDFRAAQAVDSVVSAMLDEDPVQDGGVADDVALPSPETLPIQFRKRLFALRFELVALHRECASDEQWFRQQLVDAGFRLALCITRLEPDVNGN